VQPLEIVPAIRIGAKPNLEHAHGRRIVLATARFIYSVSVYLLTSNGHPGGKKQSHSSLAGARIELSRAPSSMTTTPGTRPEQKPTQSAKRHRPRWSPLHPRRENGPHGTPHNGHSEGNNCERHHHQFVRTGIGALLRSGAACRAERLHQRVNKTRVRVDMAAAAWELSGT
jgi:hypothetical protein